MQGEGIDCSFPFALGCFRGVVGWGFWGYGVRVRVRVKARVRVRVRAGVTA
jgi:hypothetical protein